MPQVDSNKGASNTSEIYEDGHRLGKVSFAAQNDYDDPAMTSTGTHDRQTAHTDIYGKLAVAEAQIIEGKLLDADTIFSKLRAKYGYGNI